MKRRSKIVDDKGYTLVEIIVVIVILGIIGGITFQIVGAVVETFKITRDRKELYDQGRLALERMTRELRDAYEITDCSPGSYFSFKVAHPTAYGVIEEIKYQLNGTDLERVADGGAPAVLASKVDSFQVGEEGGGGFGVSASDSGTAASGATGITIANFTVAGSERLMLVGVSIMNDAEDGSPAGPGEAVSSITWNGTDDLEIVGSKITTDTDDGRIEIWKFVAPSTGTGNVEITFNRAITAEAVAGVVTFTGVDQDDPLGTFKSIADDDTAVATLDSISSASGEIVFGVICTEYDDLTASSGQTEHWKEFFSSTGAAGGTTVATSSTVDMSWDLSSSSNHWVMGGVSIKPSGSPGPIVCGGGGGGGITLDDVSDRYNTGGAGNLAHPIGSGSGNNRLLVVCYGQENNSTINSMTYNGVAMTVANNRIHRESHLSGSYNVTEMWYMLDADMPANAGTYDLGMNVSGANGPGIVVLSFEGVEQQAPETYNFSHYDAGADDTSTTQLTNVSVGSLVVSVASNGSSGHYDGSVGGAGGAGIRQSEGQPSSAGMGVSTDLSSAGGTFDVVEVSSLAPTNTNRATHIVSAFAPAPVSSPLVTLKLKLKDPNYDDNSVTLRTKVFMRNMP
jgi:prepilin-type N-terminal cleavage/methylation domain-containing protein